MKIRWTPWNPFTQLAMPLHWRKPRWVWVTDLFDCDAATDQIAAAFGLMAACPQHTFVLPTTFAVGAKVWFDVWEAGGGGSCVIRAALCAQRYHKDSRVNGCTSSGQFVRWPLRNVILGAYASDQKVVDEQVVTLLKCPAARRMIVYNGAASIDIEQHLIDHESFCWQCGAEIIRGQGNTFKQERELLEACVACEADLLTRHAIDWVYIAGMMGRHAVRCHLTHVRALIGQCDACLTPVYVERLGCRPWIAPVANVSPEFIVQHGEPDEHVRGGLLHLRNRSGSDPDEWPADLRRRELPQEIR